MNTQKYCGKIEVYNRVLKDPMNINSLIVQNSKCYYIIMHVFNFPTCYCYNNIRCTSNQKHKKALKNTVWRVQYSNVEHH